MSNLTIRRITTTWNITLNNHDYRVTNTKWAGSKWNNDGDTWTVITSHTDRVCNPDKPTHKRIVDAIKAIANPVPETFEPIHNGRVPLPDNMNIEDKAAKGTL